MQEEKLTLEVSTQDIASCNVCYAHNYDSAQGNSIGERVERLYELHIGSQVMTLCDKCLDRLREKLARRLSAEEKPEAYDGQIVLFTGTEFTATDKQSKTYRYRMIGAEVSHDGLIRMLNLDTNRLTYVEPEWFRQRKIKVLQKETGLEPDDGFYDEAGGYHEGGCGTGPDGVFCGECSDSNCAKCEVWHRRREAQK